MIIPQYYQMFRGESPQEDFKDIVFEAMRYMYVQLQTAYDGKNTAPVDTSDLPGREFGFEPVEIVSVSTAKVSHSNSKRKKGLPQTASVCYKRMLERTRWKVEYPISEESSVDRATFLSTDAIDIGKHIYEEIPDMGNIPYGIIRCGGPVFGHKLIPVLCNKMLGTIYYLVWGDYAGAMLAHSRRAHPDPEKIFGMTQAPYCSSIIAINWITGEVHSIYDAVSNMGRYFCSWELYESSRWKDDEAFLKAAFSNVNPFGEVQIAKLDSSKLEKEMCEYAGVLSNIETFTFIEDVYALPRHSLEKVSLDQTQRFFATFGHEQESIMPGLFNTLIYTKNLFQCILQTWNVNHWLLPLILTSIRLGVPMKENYRSVTQWLGITKPDFKTLVSYPDEARFVFFLCINQHTTTSMKVFEKTYSKVLELSELCDENKKEALYTVKGLVVNYSLKPVAIKTRRGRNLLVTYKLPTTLAFYMKHRLYNHGWSINHYFKWLIDECYIASHLDRPDITRTTHICGLVENYTEDYNRMAKSISPKISFTLPHNVCVSHDNMVTNFNKIIAEKFTFKEVDIDRNYKLASCYRGADADALAPIDGKGPYSEMFIVLEPKKPEDIYDEGIVLNHCVGSYCNDIIGAKGSMRIYFMRRRRFPTHNLVTVQVNRISATGEYYISEAAGKGNRKLTEEEDTYLKRWIVAYNDRIKFIKKEKDEFSKIIATTPALAPMYSRDVRRWVSEVGGKLRTAIPGLKPENVINQVNACVSDPDSIFAAKNYKLETDRSYAIQTQSAYIFGKDGLVDIAHARIAIRNLIRGI